MEPSLQYNNSVKTTSSIKGLGAKGQHKGFSVRESLKNLMLKDVFNAINKRA
jgi:hypothetical protein